MLICRIAVPRKHGDCPHLIAIGMGMKTPAGWIVQIDVHPAQNVGIPICVDFDANWTDPILNDFTHTTRTVGLMVAQGFGGFSG
jgi:hypothetical protein